MKEIFIKQINTIIRIDEDNKILLAFDVQNGITNENSEGILTEVSPSMFSQIQNELGINPNDYGVVSVNK